MTESTFKVTGYVYTNDGKSHYFSFSCKTFSSMDAKARAEAEAARCYGYANIKRCSFTTCKVS